MRNIWRIVSFVNGYALIKKSNNVTLLSAKLTSHHSKIKHVTPYRWLSQWLEEVGGTDYFARIVGKITHWHFF